MPTKRSKNMPTERPTVDFISFILDAEKDADLTLKFLEIKGVDTLHKFFQDNHYSGISRGDCKDILKAKNNWDALTDIGCGKPPCDGPKKGY